MQGRGRFDNRQQELASISRSLKGLAKELSVPILVLSQLSRAPGSALRSPAAALGPARVGRPRAGRRRRDDDLPRRASTRRTTRTCRTSPRSSSPSSATGRSARRNLAFLNAVHAVREHRAGHVVNCDRDCRPTFARVDLDALSRNFRTLAGFVAGGRPASASMRPAAAGSPGPASSAWSRPTPTGTAPCPSASRSKPPARRCSPAPTSPRACSCARAASPSRS